MGKSTHFNGQPMFGQIADLLDRKEILILLLSAKTFSGIKKQR